MRGALPVHTLRAIPGGDGGTLATLKAMRSIVRTWRTAPEVLQKATELARRCPSKHYVCEARLLLAFVQRDIRYQQDVAEVETLRTPELVLRERVGDCDDKVTLLASLLQALGHPVAFVAVAFAESGGPFSHVFLETRLGPDWVAAETTEPWALGVAPPGITRAFRFYV